MRAASIPARSARSTPDGDALFNVAIRTLTVDQGATARCSGLGSGVVADSNAGGMGGMPRQGRLRHGRRAPFDLIETMRSIRSPGWLLERHLARMKASANAFGFEFDRHSARNELQAATFRLRAPAR
jgi:para-aminobenzoate synthetase/4-amino-4-deoxychorismate lyase